MTKSIIITCIPVFSFFAGYCQKFEELHFLSGTWKVEGKETYEVWEQINENELTGSSYRIQNGEKFVTEKLSLKSTAGKVVYEATVLNQNDGKPIPFTLQENTTDGFRFENPGHDFPTKIIYKKTGVDELTVHVLGADNKGFTLKFIRQ